MLPVFTLKIGLVVVMAVKLLLLKTKLAMPRHLLSLVLAASQAKCYLASAMMLLLVMHFS
jgi:hypothetical protein